MLEFFADRGAEATNRDALRVYASKDPTDGAVLASGIQRLKNEQQRAPGFSPQPALQRLQAEVEGQDGLVQLGLALGYSRGTRALELGQVET